nr:Protein Y45F3A.1 [Haemonchus contortus]
MGCKGTRRDGFCSFAASTTIDIRRATALNADLKRRLEIEQSGYPHVDGCVLRELEKPMDYELETAEQFQEKMAHVRQLMADLLVRTNLNEWAAIEEMAEQENEVTAKIRDACNARDMLREALLESKKRAEDAMAERKERYEELQSLENQLEVCSAAAWLAITERNRLRDRLTILSKQPHVEPCRRLEQTTKVVQTVSEQISEESVVTIHTEKETTIREGATGSSDKTEAQRELLLPTNIMTTIQKVLHESLGLDVAFDGD